MPSLVRAREPPPFVFYQAINISPSGRHGARPRMQAFQCRRLANVIWSRRFSFCVLGSRPSSALWRRWVRDFWLLGGDRNLAGPLCSDRVHLYLRRLSFSRVPFTL